MTAQAHFPHDRLQGKSTDQMQEMLWQEKGPHLPFSEDHSEITCYEAVQ